MASSTIVPSFPTRGPSFEHPLSQYFGPPQWKNGRGTPQSKIRYEDDRDLYDAFEGESEYLGTTLLDGAEDVPTVLFKRVCPIRRVNKLKLVSGTMRISKSIAARGGPETLSDGISIAYEKREIELERFFKMFQINIMFWKTDMGQQEYDGKVLGVILSFARRFNVDILESLVNNEAIITAQMDPFYKQDRPRTPIDRLIKNSSLSLLVQRDTLDGWQKLHGHLRFAIRKYGKVEPDLWLIPPGFKMLVSTSKKEISFKERGPRADDMLDKIDDELYSVFDPPASVSELDLEAVFDPDAERPGQGRMFGNKPVQHFFSLDVSDAPSDPENYKTHKRNIHVLNLDENGKTLVTLEMMEKNSIMFEADGSLHPMHWYLKSVFNSKECPVPKEMRDFEMFLFKNNDIQATSDTHGDNYDVAKFMAEYLSSEDARKMVEGMLRRTELKNSDLSSIDQAVEFMRSMASVDPNSPFVRAFCTAAERQSPVNNGRLVGNKFGVTNLPKITPLTNGTYAIGYQDREGRGDLFIARLTNGFPDVTGDGVASDSANKFVVQKTEIIPYGCSLVPWVFMIAELEKFPSGAQERRGIDDAYISTCAKGAVAMRTFASCFETIFPNHICIRPGFERDLPEVFREVDTDFAKIISICQNFLGLPVQPHHINTACAKIVSGEEVRRTLLQSSSSGEEDISIAGSEGGFFQPQQPNSAAGKIFAFIKRDEESFETLPWVFSSPEAWDLFTQWFITNYHSAFNNKFDSFVTGLGAKATTPIPTTQENQNALLAAMSVRFAEEHSGTTDKKRLIRAMRDFQPEQADLDEIFSTFVPATIPGADQVNGARRKGSSSSSSSSSGGSSSYIPSHFFFWMAEFKDSTTITPNVFWPVNQRTRRTVPVGTDGNPSKRNADDYADAKREDPSFLYFFKVGARNSSNAPPAIERTPRAGFNPKYISTKLHQEFVSQSKQYNTTISKAFLLSLLTHPTGQHIFESARLNNYYYPAKFKGTRVAEEYRWGTGILCASGGKVGFTRVAYGDTRLAKHQTKRKAEVSVELWGTVDQVNPLAAARNDWFSVSGYLGGCGMTFFDTGVRRFDPQSIKQKASIMVHMMKPGAPLSSPSSLKGYYEKASFYKRNEIQTVEYDWKTVNTGSLWYYNYIHDLISLPVGRLDGDIVTLNRSTPMLPQFGFKDWKEKWSESKKEICTAERAEGHFGSKGRYPSVRTAIDSMGIFDYN